MTDGGIGEQPFEVVLEQGQVGAKQQGQQPHAAHHVKPELGAGEYGKEPGEQENAGLDHGRRVQIRAYGCRRRHGVGEPEMKRELGGLGACPEQEKHQDDGIERMILQGLVAVEHHRQFITAHHLSHQHDCRKQEFHRYTYCPIALISASSSSKPSLKPSET